MRKSVAKKRKGTYKYCFVPKCKSTTLKNPSKIFVCVPKGKIREKWIKQVRREPNTSLTTVFYCCEDHFNVNTVINFLLINQFSL